MKSLVHVCAVAALTLLAATGCDDKKGQAPAAPGRSDAVTVKSSAAQAPSATATTVAASAPKTPRELCVGESPRALPKVSYKGVSTQGALSGSPSFGVGKWVWVNLWAAWCGPCKEEMPRLIGWKDKLAKDGILIDFAFVSLDDDERQLGRFLEAQPASGVKASYWLPDDEEGRAKFLSGLGLKSAPQLPVQVLVRPDGQVGCVIRGAVEDSDYPGLVSFLKR